MILKIITLDKEYLYSENEFSIQENVKFRNLIIKKALIINNNYIVKNKTDQIVYRCSQCNREIKQKYGKMKIKIFNNDFICSKCLCENTCLERYGVKNGGGSRNSLIKMKKHFNDKYGVDNPYQSQEIKEKIKQTYMIKYGVEHNMQMIECKEKRVRTYIKHYGVENPMQNKKIATKMQQSMYPKYKLKTINKNLHYQSKPELYFINYCLDNNIHIQDGPSIKYILDDSNRVYHVDFETDKYIIEIKSSHGWYKEDLESGKIDAKNKAAQEYAASIGKEFLFLLNVKDYSFLT